MIHIHALRLYLPASFLVMSLIHCLGGGDLVAHPFRCHGLGQVNGRVLEQLVDVLHGHVRELGASPAVALNPSTPASIVAHVLDLLDMVLVMTVNPGFGGQPYKIGRAHV